MNMLSWIHKYLALTRRSMGIMLEYRMAMVIWMLSLSFPLVMLAVWLSLAQDGPVGSFAAGDFVAYYLLALYVRQLTSVWVAWELDYEIRHGDLNTKLLHPLHPIHEYISGNMAYRILCAIIFTPIVIAVALLVPDVHIVATPFNLLAFGIVLTGAWLMRYLSQFALGLFAFWFSQALVLTDVYFLLFQLLGGGVAPIELLPEPFATIANVLPFRLMLAFPIEILMGRVTPDELLTGLGWMALWIVIFFSIYRVMWARGMRRFGAFGS